MSLGLRLRTLRKNASLTQQKLADNVGVSRIYIQALESNRRVPSIKLLYRLAEALSVSANDIVDEYSPKGGRLQLEELLLSGEADVWFRKKKLTLGEMRKVERVIDALLAETDEDALKPKHRGRKAKNAE
jgi:transcriptional regulator with XRE-family HTH domain